MISICIPVYNIQVAPLLRGLQKETEVLKMPFEILVYDDGSEPKIKKENSGFCKSFEGIKYVELTQNIGRAAIRNLMGENAIYDYLLFIDADSLIPENYLHNYMGLLFPGKVLCGGTTYQELPPENPKQLLRWVYGQNREAINAAQRNSQKGFVITSNNFVIPRHLFLENRFDDKLSKYGHEDTLLGYHLFCKRVEILHVDNPVKHTGLETSEEFLDKTRQSLKNLFLIWRKIADNEGFADKIALLKVYQKLHKYGLIFIPRLFYTIFSAAIKQNLLGKYPSVKLFDVYKLGYFCTLKKP